MTSAPRTALSTTAGLFLLCLANLMFELLLTRIFSVTMWYHFAFLAISVAMFGMTVGALLVYLLPQVFTADRAHRQLALLTFLFALSMPLSLLTHMSVPFKPDLTVLGMYSVSLTYVALAVPFALSGVAVCIALTKFPARVSVLYAADLAGAATGCILLIGLISVTDGPTAVFVVGLVAMVSAVLFAIDAPGRGLLWLSMGCAALLAIVLAPHLLGTASEPLVRLRWVKDTIEQPPLYEKWNSFSRIRVSGDASRPSRPFGWGLSRADPEVFQPIARQLMLDIDATAGTIITGYSGDPSTVQYLKHDIVNLAHWLRPESSVLVIGTGGGRDVLTALAFEQPRIVGVEINGDTIETVNERYGDFTGHLDRNPSVTFVNDDARSWIARQTDRFDIIQISLIDTWAATAAGAFVLAENSLYTVEAWTTFLEHLTPEGIFTVSRWYYGDRPGEMYRSLSLATAALRRIGVENPRDHLAVVRNMQSPTRGSGTILVSRQPLTEIDLYNINEVARQLQFEVMLTPTSANDETFAKLASGADLEKFYEAYPLDLRPTTDDTPFFFQMLRLRAILGAGPIAQGQNDFNLNAVVVLGTILVVVTVLTILCIIVPLFLARGPRPSIQSAPLFLFFGAIGLGFMLVEVSLMQRLTVFLGHPTYSLSVVLFSLLLAGGLGSFLTRNLRGDGPPRAMLVRLGCLLAVVAIVGLALPSTVHNFDGATTPVRIGIALALLVPLGLCMGMAFPMGMKLANVRAESLTAWLWGINGATSVWGSVLAVVIALSSRISTAFWSGWTCYLVAFAALFWATRSILVQRPAAEVVDVPAAEAKSAEVTSAARPAESPARRRTRVTVWAIAVLLCLAAGQGLVIARMLVQRSRPVALDTGREGGMRFADENVIRRAYPNVDFRPIYPGWSDADIDQIQREIYGLRYLYQPFTEFRPAPVEKRFVTVTEAGYRMGAAPQPWPPDADDYSVFVFGGSTTFSYGVPNDQTLVARLQEEIQQRHPELRVEAYNFGAGHYFSSQERELFESLLLRGIVPDAAIFVDGINDYYFYDGHPVVTAALYSGMSPDLPPPVKPVARTREDLQVQVGDVLQRYRRNASIIEALAREYGVHVVFVGQPVPFLDMPYGPKTYPFPPPVTDHRLCALGYPLFAQTAEAGGFGPNFIWCGDAFAAAQSFMYADPLHYSADGTRRLAQLIVERAAERGLLP